MSDSNSTSPARFTPVILRGVEGEFAEALLVFRAGFAVGPFSLGQQGDWRVSADGVANIHVYLWFDGLVLHAARLRGGPDAWVNGEPLREDWCALSDGSELRVGSAKVVVSAKEEGDSEQRQVAPLDHPTPPIVVVAPEAAPRPGIRSRLGLAPRGRLTRRVVLALCIVPAAVLLWLMWARAGHPRSKAAPAPNVDGSSVGIGPVAPSAANSVALEAPPTPGATSEPTIETEATRLSAAPATSELDVQKLERRAADAVFRGDFQTASTFYTELSARVPGSRAFAIARAVASNKAGPKTSGF